MNIKRNLLLLLTAASLTSNAQTKTMCSPLPTENLLRWQEMEMYAFIHYSMNTYTDGEWGFGNEPLELFNPSDLDCRQWVSTDWQDWKKVASDEFSNIVNNPIWQTIKLDAPVKAKILRLDADRLAEGDRMAFGDIEVVTK